MSVYDITPTQVLSLCKTKFHYYLFLVILISKKRILRSDLKNKFKEIKTLDIVVNDLLNSNLFVEEDLFITCISFNVKFPSIKEYPQLEKYYKQLDIWDQQFPETFKMENLITKVYVKKISVRAAAQIQGFLESTIAAISSEINQDNELDSEIAHIQIIFNKGDIKL